MTHPVPPPPPPPPPPPVPSTDVPTIDNTWQRGWAFEVTMTPRPPAPLHPEKARRDQLVNAYLDAKAKAESANQAVVDLLQELLAEFKPGETHCVAPGIGITVRRPSRKFDEDRATYQLRELGLAPESYVKWSVDWVAVKAVLKEHHRMDMAMAEGTGNPSVVVL